MPCTTAGAPSWHKLVAVYAKLQVPAHFDLSADATSAASLLLDPWAHEPSDLIKGQVCRFGLRTQGLGLRTKGLGRASDGPQK